MHVSAIPVAVHMKHERHVSAYSGTNGKKIWLVLQTISSICGSMAFPGSRELKPSQIAHHLSCFFVASSLEAEAELQERPEHGLQPLSIHGGYVWVSIFVVEEAPDVRIVSLGAG